MILRQRRAMLSPRLRPLVALAPVAWQLFRSLGEVGLAPRNGDFFWEIMGNVLEKNGWWGFLWDKYDIVQCGAPKIAKLVYNSNNYGLWYL